MELGSAGPPRRTILVFLALALTLALLQVYRSATAAHSRQQQAGPSMRRLLTGTQLSTHQLAAAQVDLAAGPNAALQDNLARLEGAWKYEKSPKGEDSAYLSMCISVRDEHCDIREWVLHHAALGARKFYIFDTQSSPPMRPVLQDLISSVLVHYQYVTNQTKGLGLEEPTGGRGYNWQSPIFSRCLKRFGGRHKWMAFIDADEFVMLQEGGPASLPELLQQYESHAALALHWRLFSFDGHIERPPAGVLASYTACWPKSAGTHLHVKSIVQPALTLKPDTPHNFKFKNESLYAINTSGVRVDGPILLNGQPSFKGAILHHYVSKSLADFEVKSRRKGGAGSVKTLHHFLKWSRRSTEQCLAAVAWGRELGARYDLRHSVPERCWRLPEQ